MPFDWRNFLLLAHELKTDPRETVQRTCIGRAYYYAYNLGLSEATVQGYDWRRSRLKNAGVHAKLWDWYLRNPDPQFKQLGDLGNGMRGRRTHADYKDAIQPRLQQDVEKQLSEARQFEVLLSQITGHPTPPDIP